MSTSPHDKMFNIECLNSLVPSKKHIKARIFLDFLKKKKKNYRICLSILVHICRLIYKILFYHSFCLLILFSIDFWICINFFSHFYFKALAGCKKNKILFFIVRWIMDYTAVISLSHLLKR